MSNIVKANFIQFSAENTKVIDTNSLVAKRLEGFSGVLRESLDDEYADLGPDIPGTEDMDPLAMAELLADRDENGEPIGHTVSESATESEFPEEETADDVQRMKEEALAEIERVRQAARSEVDELREKARKEGFDEGYSSGRRQAEEESAAGLAELEAKRASLDEEYRKLAADLEPKIVEAITDVYKSVFGESLYSKKDVMNTLIMSALFNTSGESEITVRVSPADFEDVSASGESLKERAGIKGELTVVADERLSPTEAKVETAFGIMDCSIDTEAEELSKTLRMLSYGGKM